MVSGVVNLENPHRSNTSMGSLVVLGGAEIERSESRRLQYNDHIKGLVYETLVPSVEENAGISVTDERIRKISGIVQNARNSKQRSCQAYQTTSCRNFEHML
ncbi:hypothetical protein TNCV_1777711 [Trichonephila clavipes]|nr:hypothetical protein TNCV_1777711 [Trichonephila clavipes]